MTYCVINAKRRLLSHRLLGTRLLRHEVLMHEVALAQGCLCTRLLMHKVAHFTLHSVCVPFAPAVCWFVGLVVCLFVWFALSSDLWLHGLRLRAGVVDTKRPALPRPLRHCFFNLSEEY